MAVQPQQEEQQLTSLAPTHPRLFKMTVNVNNRYQALTLLDSGASTNFINQQFVDLNNIETTEADKEQRIDLADGTNQYSTKKAKKIKIKLNSHQDEVDCIVLPLGGCDMILGMEWFERNNPVIDWKNKTATVQEHRIMANKEKTQAEQVNQISQRESSSSHSG